jgi:hypothetical protein
MAFTTAQQNHLNKMNKAAQNVSLGTTLAPLASAAPDAASLGAMNKIEATVAFGDFTDGGGAVGTYELSDAIPIGAFVFRSVLQPALVGFAGDTSATIQIGDGTDVDRYSTGTPDVFSDVAGGIDLGAVSGTAYHAAAKTPTITITTDSDWTSVSAGSLSLAIYYFV